MKYTYIGLRMSFDETKSFQTFLDEKGEKTYFNRIRYVAIGGIYQGTKNKMERTPKQLGDVKAKQEWLDADSAVRHQLKRMRECRKGDKLAERYYYKSLQELHRQCTALSGSFERHAFAKAVARIVIEGKKA